MRGEKVTRCTPFILNRQTLELVGVKGAAPSTKVQGWSPWLRQWRRQTLTYYRGEGGGLWGGEGPRRSLWGAPSWCCPRMPSLPWRWTLGKTSMSDGWDQTNNCLNAELYAQERQNKCPHRGWIIMNEYSVCSAAVWPQGGELGLHHHFFWFPSTSNQRIAGNWTSRTVHQHRTVTLLNATLSVH